MILRKIWNYFKGYVIILLTGFTTERFMNIAVRKGINFSNMKRTEKGIYAQICAEDFKKLKPISRLTGCRIRICSRGGLPFYIRAKRNKKLFVVGTGVFLCIIMWFSSFVWLVEVEGNERISSADILSFCAENGLKEGEYIKKIDTKEIERLTRIRFPDISWIKITVKGTRATIRMTEGIPKNAAYDNAPCDIAASGSGIIVSVVTSSGTPMVKAGDTVSKGDILVSSALVITDGETSRTEYTHCEAQIKAKQWFSFKIPLVKEYTEKKYIDKSRKSYNVTVFGKQMRKNFEKSDNKYEKYDRIITEKRLYAGKNFPLPVIITVCEDKPYELSVKKANENQIKAIAENKAERIINSMFSEDEVINKNYIYKNDALYADITVITDIGVRIENKGEADNEPNKNTNTQ